jgi:hypothetical protein
MPVGLFNEWGAYFALEPGMQNTNNQLAMIGSMLTGKNARKFFRDFGGVVPTKRQWSDDEIREWVKTFG